MKYMTHSHTSVTGHAHAREIFDREGLPFPPVPTDLLGRLIEHGEFVFATRELEASPYDLASFVQDAGAHPDQPEYAVVGFAGHGINSWAVHYYFVRGGLALFVQLPWGGAHLNEQEARKEITNTFEWVSKVQAKAGADKRQLQIVVSGFSESGWRWWSPAGKDSQPIPWNNATGMQSEILRMLDAGA